MRFLLCVFIALLGMVDGALTVWTLLAAVPGSHALDRGYEPSLWLEDDERGQDP